MKKSKTFVSMLMSIILILTAACILPVMPVQAEEAPAAAWEYVFFGMYPQEKIEERSLINKLYEFKTDEYGIFEYRGNKYRRTGGDFWLFKPLKWRVLSKQDGFYTLLTDEIVASCAFGAGNWEVSEVRTWLNNDFLNIAFTDGEREDIGTTKNTYRYPNGSGSCIDTVYLLSENEYMNPAYGFPMNKDACVEREGNRLPNVGVTTPAYGDYNNEKGTVFSWTRDLPAQDFFDTPTYVTCDGELTFGHHVYYSWVLGVRPALRVALNSKYVTLEKPLIGNDYNTSTNSPEQERYERFRNNEPINELDIGKKVFSNLRTVSYDCILIDGLDQTHIIQKDGTDKAVYDMVPQGVCIARSKDGKKMYKLISAYSESGKNGSVIYVQNGWNEYLTTLNLYNGKEPLICHVGSLDFWEDEVLIADSKSNVIRSLSVDEITKAVEKDSDAVIVNCPVKFKVSNTPSFITVYDNKLYAGTFYKDAAKPSTVNIYRLKDGKQLTAEPITLPTKKAQGMALYKKDNNLYVFISSSYGRNNISELIIAKWREDGKSIKKTAGIEMPNMSEDLYLETSSSTNLYVAFESGANVYKDITDSEAKKDKIRPLDRALSLNVDLIFKYFVTSHGIGMFRLYNPNSGEHFYTAKEKEKDALASFGWLFEGIGWNAPKSSKTPVYRLYNELSGDHHYTMKTQERDYLRDIGWTYEGIGWYSDDEQKVPLYREYNPNMKSCNHNYTTNQKEHNALTTLLGWKDEGIGWYGVGE